MTREELALAYPDNAILDDRAGRPTVMVYVPKFDLDEVISGAPHLPHPAFVVEGRVLDGIYVSKFQNVIVDGCAYSLPGEDPATHVDFDDREVALYANNGKEERIPFRGGRWGQGRNAGLFKTCFDDPRTYSGAAVGFRSAYYRVD